MGFIRRCIRRLKWKTKTGDVMNHDIPIHEGIKTIGVENDCDFSSSSELCICIVTWNMNGQVSYGDIKELVGRDRKFHLLVVGLQEAPRNNISRHISSSLFSKNLNPYARPDQITIWLGDLNYRLQGINTFPARSLIRKNLHELLTSKDQLLQEAERGQIFSGYCEGTLAFKPTYKYDIGSSSYDTSHKVRVPSWTDRILFKIDDIDNINATLHSYESIETIHSSDHRPVKAHLCLKLNTRSSPISNKACV
ncbi:inositol polyphosphate 5-phosphatase 11 [Actinidia rufa]|uniref:Inositol polyphosphate 5-phosphatase 11 n=1 Tax=Actinidia rufa TaxID=165716 RepID=A0A7J0GHS5_9ERIC|nr:inositol polyphosphate 5-phosphatase 11 [Actinidia rufa]